MILALVIIIVAMASASCVFFAMRWDKEREENIRLRCEAEVREHELRDQLSRLLTEQATFVNTARLQLEAIYQKKKIPQLAPVAPRMNPPSPNGVNHTEEPNLVYFKDMDFQ